MTLDDLRRALEVLPAGTSLTLPRDELLRAIAEAPRVDIGVAVDAERWLSAEDVAKLLGVSKRYVYAHVPDFPFAKRLPGGGVRFSDRGLQRWMERVR